MPAYCDWRVVPEVRVSGGDESDLILDPGFSRTVVPGGQFVELTPTIAARRWLGRQVLLDVGTYATPQLYLNDQSRFVYAHTVWGDVMRGLGGGFRGRLSASGDYFDDSEREAIRHAGTGGEMGLGYGRARWNVEAWGGGRGRWYPNVDVVTGRNKVSTYNEKMWSGGVRLYVAPQERLKLSGNGTYQSTDSKDPYYDSFSWTADGSVDLRLVSSFFLTFSGTFQTREFTERTAGLDSDDYVQFGAGLRYSPVPGLTALVRYGYSDYTWPDGNAQDTHRLAVGFYYVWGRRSAMPPPRVDISALTEGSGGTIQQPDEAGNVVFRVKADGAARVAVVGNFNGWDAGANPLRPAAGGWWETRLELGPGTYEYVYIIDGKTTTPPEAKVTVNDGFGGLNGIIEVLPPGL